MTFLRERSWAWFISTENVGGGGCKFKLADNAVNAMVGMAMDCGVLDWILK